MQSHRFLYVVLNHYDLEPKKLMIVPYLHERKIYLNRIKVNTNYFYTSILKEVDFSDPIEKTKSLKGGFFD